MKLRLFPSKRAIYNFNAKASDGLIDSAMDIATFFRFLICVEGKRRAYEVEQFIYMQNACSLMREEMSRAGIFMGDSFFEFLKNKHYLFAFFKELAIQKKCIDDLRNCDSYAMYEEHLDILDRLLKSYKELLDKNKVFDEISLDTFEINTALFTNYDEIIYELAGNINAWELEVFNEVSKYIKFTLIFKIDRFNQVALSKALNLNLLEAREYALNLNTKELKELQSIKYQKDQIIYSEFDNDFMQLGFVYEQIDSFYKQGAKDIVVITPNPRSAELLKAMDFKNYLNLAAGFSLQLSRFYQAFSLLKEVEVDKKKLDFLLESSDFLLKKRDLLLAQDYVSLLDFSNFIHLICSIDKEEVKSRVQIGLEELAPAFLIAKLSYKDACALLDVLIRELRLYDLSTGPVTLLGTLESRGLSFDACIIIDFNDDLIPKRAASELYLSDTVRKHAGLISYEDRENLQRHYYYSLLHNSKLKAICALRNEASAPSRFLKHLNIKNTKSKASQIIELINSKSYKELDLSSFALYAKEQALEHKPLSSPLSYSRLHCFRSNKQEYFLKYILKLKDPEADESSADIGSFAHRVLELYYSGNYDIKACIKKAALDFDTSLLNQSLWENYLSAIVESLKSEQIKALELDIEDISIKLGPHTIRARGKIDRVDIHEGNLRLVDYKSGALNAKVLTQYKEQLVFYKEIYEVYSKSYVDELAIYFLKDDDLCILSEDDIKAAQRSLIECINNMQAFSNAGYQEYFSEDFKEIDFSPYFSFMLSKGLL